MGSGLAADTVLEHEMLRTRIGERDMAVTTFLGAHVMPPMRAPWTAVWRGPWQQLVWLHFWQGPVTPGGLEEAHESVVARVRAGTLPARDQDVGHIGPGGRLERKGAQRGSG